MADETKDEVVVTVRLTKAGHEKIRELAERDDRSMAYMIRKALAEMIERES